MKYCLEYKPAGEEAPMFQVLTEHDFSEICMADLRMGNPPDIYFSALWGDLRLIIREQ